MSKLTVKIGDRIVILKSNHTNMRHVDLDIEPIVDNQKDMFSIILSLFCSEAESFFELLRKRIDNKNIYLFAGCALISKRIELFDMLCTMFPQLYDFDIKYYHESVHSQFGGSMCKIMVDRNIKINFDYIFEKGLYYKNTELVSYILNNNLLSQIFYFKNEPEDLTWLIQEDLYILLEKNLISPSHKIFIEREITFNKLLCHLLNDPYFDIHRKNGSLMISNLHLYENVELLLKYNFDPTVLFHDVNYNELWHKINELQIDAEHIVNMTMHDLFVKKITNKTIIKLLQNNGWPEKSILLLITHMK